MTDVTVLYITKGFERTTRTLENLNETNDLTVGQVFLTVAKHFNKEKEEYKRWPSFEFNRGEFDVIQGIVDECQTDLEKLKLVCEWLEEEEIK